MISMVQWCLTRGSKLFEFKPLKMENAYCTKSYHRMWTNNSGLNSFVAGMYIFGVVFTMVVVGAYTYLVSRPKPFNRTLGPVHGTGVQRSVCTHIS